MGKHFAQDTWKYQRKSWKLFIKMWVLLNCVSFRKNEDFGFRIWIEFEFTQIASNWEMDAKKYSVFWEFTVRYVKFWDIFWTDISFGNGWRLPKRSRKLEIIYLWKKFAQQIPTFFMNIFHFREKNEFFTWKSRFLR